MTQNAYSGRKVMIDVETTGVDERKDRIVEIAGIEVIDFKRTGREFHEFVNPGMTMTDEVIAIHKITNEFLKDKPSMRTVMPRFLDFIGDADLVAHNAPFDMGMLNSELRRLGRQSLPNRSIDTLTEARIRVRASRLNLRALCERFGLDAGNKQFHNAMFDTNMLVDLYAAMLGSAEMDLALAPAPSNLIREPRMDLKPDRGIGRPTEPELAAHAAFVSGIKKPLWAAG